MTGRRLYLSKENRMIAGVAGGIGEFFDVDPTIVRILFLLLLLPGGAGLIVYIGALIVIPEPPKEKVSTASKGRAQGQDRQEGEVTEKEQEAIEELKAAAKDLADAGGEVAENAAQRVRTSIQKLSQTKETEDLDDGGAGTDEEAEGRGQGREIEVRSSDGPQEETTAGRDSDDRSNKIIGLILVAVGIFFLSRHMVPWFAWSSVWPVILIIAGAVILLKGLGER